MSRGRSRWSRKRRNKRQETSLQRFLVNFFLFYAELSEIRVQPNGAETKPMELLDNQCHKSTIQHWKVLNIGELVGRLVEWLVGWFVGWFVGWLDGCLVCWFVGLLDGWFVRQNWIKEHCSGENLHR